MPKKIKPSTKAAPTPELNVPKELLDQLVSGPMTQGYLESMFRSLKKAVIERAMKAEMSEHLGYEAGESKHCIPRMTPACDAILPRMLQPSSSSDVQAQIVQLETLLSERTAELEAHKQRIRLLEEALRVSVWSWPLTRYARNSNDVAHPSEDGSIDEDGETDRAATHDA